MASHSFVVQKLIGREFEQAMMPVLEQAGFRVIDTDHFSYRQKKGRDIIVEVQGQRASLELKYNLLLEKTNKVCIDWDSMIKTQSRYGYSGFLMLQVTVERPLSRIATTN
jgi:hypothetical protein